MRFDQASKKPESVREERPESQSSTDEHGSRPICGSHTGEERNRIRSKPRPGPRRCARPRKDRAARSDPTVREQWEPHQAEQKSSRKQKSGN